jgi:organic radical activating enzyme
MKKTLRLIYTPVCNRNCEGCCNKDFDLDNLPRPDHFNYDEIFITGGEPMLFLDEVIGFIKALRLITKAKIYVYTAYLSASGAGSFHTLLSNVDGITLTLHEIRDWHLFQQLEFVTKNMPYIFEGKSMRLNIFKDAAPDMSLDMFFFTNKTEERWKVKRNIEWIKNCPLPENEVLMKVY